jgi:hypothetical protein
MRLVSRGIAGPISKLFRGWWKLNTYTGPGGFSKLPTLWGKQGTVVVTVGSSKNSMGLTF